MTFRRLLPLLAGVLGLLFWAGGCSSDLGSVSGYVKLDGKPLPKAMLTFQPSGKGRASKAITDENGNYQLYYQPNVAGAKIGSHVVSIISEFEDYDDEGKLVRREEMLPEKYHAKTELKAEVKPGSNIINWDLQSE